MSTGLIVVIVVAAIIILALLVMLPRMRAASKRNAAERELHSRRDRVAGEHREAATARERSAERAEQKARLAEQAAEKERAEAGLEQQRAEMHDRGLADDELIDDHERDRFADVVDRDADRDGVDDRNEPGAAGSTSAEYEQGREDERRIERERITDDVRESERPR